MNESAKIYKLLVDNFEIYFYNDNKDVHEHTNAFTHIE